MNKALVISLLTGYYFLTCLVSAGMFVQMLTFPMFLICIFNISSIKSSIFTPEDMIWLCVYLFFVIQPSQAIDGNYITGGPVDGIRFERYEFVSAMGIIFIFFLFVSVFKYVFGYSRVSIAVPRFNILMSGNQFLAITIFNYLIFFSYIAVVGVSAALASRSGKGADLNRNIVVMMQSMQIISTIIIVSYVKNRKFNSLHKIIVMCISLLMLAVSQNPFNTPRFFLLAS